MEIASVKQLLGKRRYGFLDLDAFTEFPPWLSMSVAIQPTWSSKATLRR